MLLSKNKVLTFLGVCSLIITLSACSDTSSSKDTHDIVKIEEKNKNSKKETKLFIKVPNTVETDINGVATITGKTVANAKVKIGLGILGDSTESDSKGFFSLTYELSDDMEEITINVKKGKNSISDKVNIKISSEKKAKEKEEKELEDNFGIEPKKMKKEATPKQLDHFTVKNQEFRTNLYSSKGNFTFKTAKIFNTSAGNVLLLQYYLTTTEGSKYAEDEKDELPSLYGSFHVYGKVEDGEDYNEDLSRYRYNGIDGGAWSYEGIKPLSDSDYKEYPVLKKLAGSTEIDETKYPIGKKVLVTEGYYLSRNDIRNVHITLDQAPLAEIWLSVE